MRRVPYESAAAPTSHSATDPAEFNVACCSKPSLPNQTDSNAALLPYLTHQLGSAHEWSGVWNGPHSYINNTCYDRYSQSTKNYAFSTLRTRNIHIHNVPSSKNWFCPSVPVSQEPLQKTKQYTTTTQEWFLNKESTMVIPFKPLLRDRTQQLQPH